MNLDFEVILFYAVLISGVLALFDIVFLASRRKRKNIEKPSIIFDYARSFFPVLLIVFLLRSFLYEQFRIPSGSLKPTLLVGDFPLINKYIYGIRLPMVHKKIIDRGTPQRGDIMVLRWPANPSIYFIKRVIGLPGDHISYTNKKLIINGHEIPLTYEKEGTDSDDGQNSWKVSQYQEDLLGVKHSIYLIPDRTSMDFKDIIVPQGMYFVLGDNRDDSGDSRYWGFVPDENIVGKAEYILLSWDSQKHMPRWDRIGKAIH